MRRMILDLGVNVESSAVEKRVEAPDEVPELLVELADGAMAGLGLSRGEVCRIHAKS